MRKIIILSIIGLLSVAGAGRAGESLDEQIAQLRARLDYLLELKAKGETTIQTSPIVRLAEAVEQLSADIKQQGLTLNRVIADVDVLKARASTQSAEKWSPTSTGTSTASWGAASQSSSSWGSSGGTMMYGGQARVRTGLFGGGGLFGRLRGGCGSGG